MQRLFVLLLLADILFGQILPTVPSNVFRFSYGSSISESKWDLKEQSFDLRGIGRHYFDNLTHNDSVRFSSNHDLYHNGSLMVDSVNTIEEWLTRFNSDYGFFLPVFGAQLIDTSKGVSPSGLYLESRDKKTTGKTFMVEYGLSNEVTLSVSVPILDSYTIDRSITDYSIKGMDDVDALLNYHTNAKSDFYDFIHSSNYSGLRRGLKDTLSAIYDTFYDKSSEFSVLWATHAGNDPLNNLLVDARFIPQDIGRDTVSLIDLVSYYYPSEQSGSGVNDVTVGATILLKGKPTWATDGKTNALYAQIFLGIPYGKTLSSFKAVGSKQFTEPKIGNGVSRWSIGVYGNSGLKGNTKGRMYFQTLIKFSTSEILNTPVGLFSGGHTNPDSITSQIGNTYKFDQGLGLFFRAGGELDMIPNQLRIRTELNYTLKGQDRFVSKDPDWDTWMQEHVGFNSSFKRMDLRAEIWLLNSISKNRIGPISFDLYAGFKNSIIAENTFDGWNVYTGITTYYQGW